MDWGSSLFILLVFVILGAQISASIGMKSIQENWPAYRCNPMFMPFAGSLAPTPTTAGENFSYCMHDFMSSAAPSLTQPLSFTQAMTLELVKSMATSHEKSVEQSSNFSFSISNVFNSLFNVVSSIAGQFNLIIYKLMDAQGKMMAAITAILYIVTATQYAFMSMWNGIPGKLIKSFDNMKIDTKKKKKKK